MYKYQSEYVCKYVFTVVLYNLYLFFSDETIFYSFDFTGFVYD